MFLRFEVYCVPDCLPGLFLARFSLVCLRLLGSPAWLYGTGCLLFYVLVALGGFVPSALPGLGPSVFSLPDAGHSV